MLPPGITKSMNLQVFFFLSTATKSELQISIAVVFICKVTTTISFSYFQFLVRDIRYELYYPLPFHTLPRSLMRLSSFWSLTFYWPENGFW